MAEENEKGDEYNRWGRGKSRGRKKRMKGLVVAERMDSLVSKLILFNFMKCPKGKLLPYFEKLPLYQKLCSLLYWLGLF